MWGTFGYGISLALYYSVHAMLVGLCITMLVRALWPPFDLHRTACCGACGHPVVDILQGRCSECGGLYARVGISTPPMAVRLRSGLTLALLAWTTIALVAASLSFAWIQERAMVAYQSAATSAPAAAPPPPATSIQAEFHPLSHGSSSDSETSQTDALALEFRISVELDWVENGGKVQTGTAVFRLRRTGKADSYSMNIDLSDGSFELRDSADSKILDGDSVDHETIERWFYVAGIPCESAGVQRSMADALALVDFAKNDPAAIGEYGTNLNPAGVRGGSLQLRSSSSGPSSTSTSYYTSSVAFPSFNTATVWLTGGFLSFLYLCGVAFIIWRHRRLVRA